MKKHSLNSAASSVWPSSRSVLSKAMIYNRLHNTFIS